MMKSRVFSPMGVANSKSYSWNVVDKSRFCSVKVQERCRSYPLAWQPLIKRKKREGRKRVGDDALEEKKQRSYRSQSDRFIDVFPTPNSDRNPQPQQVRKRVFLNFFSWNFSHYSKHSDYRFIRSKSETSLVSWPSLHPKYSKIKNPVLKTLIVLSHFSLDNKKMVFRIKCYITQRTAFR